MRAAILAVAAVAFGPCAASAQQVRNYSGSVLLNNSIDFDHWLNYDENTCADRGFVTVQMRDAPKLGKISIMRKKVTGSGPCAGHPVSAVIIIYRAGGKAGVDQFSYGVQGAQAIVVNAAVTVN